VRLLFSQELFQQVIRRVKSASGQHPAIGVKSRPETRNSRPRRIAPLSAVENLVTKVFQSKRYIIGAPGRLSFDTRILHLAYKDRVVALLYGVHQSALNEGRRILENRRTQTAFVKRLATDEIALSLQGLEKSKSLPLLILS
jgi:hypothetical protein